jgi:ATP-binding cassette subfamily B multidrug efflux pump
MKNLFHLNPYFLRYPKHLFGGVAFVILSVLFQTYPAVFIREAFASVELAIANGVTNALHQDLLRYSLLILFFSALRGLFTFLMRQTLIVMSRHIEYDLKNDLYAQYQNLDAAFYRKNNTGDLMNRISEDVSRVRMYLGPAVMYSINTFFATLLALIFMFRVDVELSLWVLAPMPFLVWAIYKVSDRINKASQDVQEQQSRMSTFAQETFSGIRVLKAFAAEDSQKTRYQQAAEESYQKNARLFEINALFQPLMLLLVGLSTVLAVWIGGLGVIEGKWSSGVIAEFIYYVNLLTWPIASIGWVMSLIQRAEASMARIHEFMQERPIVIGPVGGYCPEHVRGAWTFENVGFTYPDTGIEALKGLDFRIEPGELVVITGKTGSGKSTLAQLLVRSMDPTSGRILLDGVDLRDWDLPTLRKHIAFVPQDAFLFSDTVGNNLRFGSPFERTEDQVITASKWASVHEDIEGFSSGYNTEIGERGVSLSGGQKQRISIARALLKEAPILVMDDALSAVDTKTESTIVQVLPQAVSGRTVLLIAQRLTVGPQADKIVVLEQGKVAEFGTHKELLEKSGIYASFVQLQSQKKKKGIEATNEPG